MWAIRETAMVHSRCHADPPAIGSRKWWSEGPEKHLFAKGALGSIKTLNNKHHRFKIDIP